MSDLLYIFVGLSVTFLSFFLVTWGITALYFKVSKEKFNWLRDVKVSSSVAGVGVLATLLLMMAVSNTSIYLFAFISFLFSGLVYTLFLKYVWKFSYFDASVISFTLAIILNLGWLRLLGIV